VIECERSDEHSEKPVIFYEIIEEMYDHGPRLELFARRTRAGWDAWGNEARN
jgi:N6-adenosine-specific RNA methylase IME4